MIDFKEEENAEAELQKTEVLYKKSYPSNFCNTLL